MRFSGAIDTVGGDILIKILKSLNAGASVAACGMASSVDLHLQIYPFILRGARLLGIYSADSPLELKQKVWNKFSKEWNFPMDKIVKTIHLEEAPHIMQDILGQNNPLVFNKLHARLVYDFRQSYQISTHGNLRNVNFQLVRTRL